MLRERVLRKATQAATQRSATGVGAVLGMSDECSTPMQPQQPKSGDLLPRMVQIAKSALQCSGGVLVQQGEARIQEPMQVGAEEDLKSTQGER